MALIFKKFASKVFSGTVVGLLVVAMASTSLAQAAPETRSTGGPRRQLATILFAGLGGAVLGLSTLSFYGRPQDKLANIAIGFAGGVIIGTTFVTYKAATNPSEFYGQTKSQFEDEIERSRPRAQTAPEAPLYVLNFEF
jgi:hypothetical protein